MILRVFFSIALASAILFGDFVSPALAQVLTSEQQLKIAELNKKILANPIDFQPLADRGTIYFLANRLSEAQQDIDRALVLNPNWRQGHVFLVKVKKENGHIAEAITEFDKAQKISELSAREYLLRSTLYGMLKQYPAACKDIDKSIMLDPRYAPAYKCRAVTVWQWKGASSSVVSDFKTCLSLEPSDNQCQELLAKVTSAEGAKHPPQ